MTILPRKRYGQHFLCDQGVIRRIIQALNPQKDEHLVEIGPGQGALTLPLVRQHFQLEVIEIDRDLVEELRDRIPNFDALSIFPADVLDFDFAKLKQDKRLLRVFGNLPYNISTPLIFHLLEYTDIISDMLFMLQKEVADRLAAKVGDENYGRLSVMVQYQCAVQTLFDVPSQAFFPPPKVLSSIVQLRPFQVLPYQVKDYSLFALLVRQAFGQRRKTLRNSLKNLVSDEIWEAVSIRSDLRAENLSVKDFVEIVKALEN